MAPPKLAGRELGSTAAIVEVFQAIYEGCGTHRNVQFGDSQSCACCGNKWNITNLCISGDLGTLIGSKTGLDYRRVHICLVCAAVYMAAFNWAASHEQPGDAQSDQGWALAIKKTQALLITTLMTGRGC